MTKQEFEELIMIGLRNEFGEYGYAIQSTAVLKENGCLVDAISISSDQKIMPLIKVDVIYQAYLNGVSTDLILKDLVREINGDVPINIDGVVEKMSDFNLVKDCIFASLVNTEYNKMWLLNKPHRDINDLSIIYHVIFQQDRDKIMRAAITDEVFEEWGIEADTLHDIAMKNTNSEYPPVLSSIEQKIKELLVCTECPSSMPQFDQPIGMIVVSNNIGMYGAIHMFNAEILQNIAELLGTKQLYILPSSVHEIIACSSETMLLEYANQMVIEVNQTMDPKDVLSNHVYLYDRDTNKIS